MSRVEPCCRRSAHYNIRRYDPIGRTQWVRDYFAGSTGQHSDPLNLPCRLIVDSAQDLIFVSGPLCWINPDDPRTWWNLACYTTAGNLLWRRRLGRDENSGGAIDVAMVNGRFYAMVEEIESVGFPPNFDGFSIIEFDRNGNPLRRATSTGVEIGPRFLVGDPARFYNLPAFEGEAQGPPGLTTFGWAVSGIAACAAYFPSSDDYIIAVPPPNTGAVFDIIWPTVAPLSDGLITSLWGPTEWGIQNNPHDLFGSPEKVWVVPAEMSPTPDRGVFCAADFATYYLFEEGEAEGTPLGTGTLARLSGDDGLPVWFRGIAALRCVTSDNDGRLYAGSLNSVEAHPTIQRWSQDGEFIWGHRHNAISQIALVDDRGIVTIGNRVIYGENEQQWITEGSVET